MKKILLFLSILGVIFFVSGCAGATKCECQCAMADLTAENLGTAESENTSVRNQEAQTNRHQESVENASNTARASGNNSADKASQAEAGEDVQNSNPDDAAEIGYLKITAKPWAIVTIDGTRLGSTPLGNRKIKVGRHKLELSYTAESKKWTRAIEINEGEQLSIMYDFSTGELQEERVSAEEMQKKNADGRPGDVQVELPF